MSAQETGDALLELAPLPTVEADPAQIRQLLQNLLSNALKYRRADVPIRIHIESRLLRSASAHPSVQIRICDNGIGFENKYRDRIFTPFERLHGRDQYAGTGMGLAICRRIVERHDGTIEAEGVLGEGATFVITLPLKQQEARR